MTIHFALGFEFSSKNLDLAAKLFEKVLLVYFSLELSLQDWIYRVKIGCLTGQHPYPFPGAILL